MWVAGTGRHLMPDFIITVDADLAVILWGTATIGTAHYCS